MGHRNVTRRELCANEDQDGCQWNLLKKTADNLFFYRNLAGIMRQGTRRFVFAMTKHSPLRRTLREKNANQQPTIKG